MNNKEFQREDRYVVVKLKKLTHTQERHLRSCLHGEGINTVESVVVEKDWPEYHLVWMMLEHRMAGKPVPDFNAVRHVDEIQKCLADAEQRNAELVELPNTVSESVTGRNGTFARIPDDWFNKRDAALNPA